MEKEKMIFEQQQAQPRHMIVELMPKACTTCGKVVHAFFQSQEEFDNFKCVDCKDIVVQQIVEPPQEETNEPTKIEPDQPC